MSDLTIYGYIAVMALATWSIRALPLVLMKRPIENIFIQSFLHYVPYVTLSVMTFPAIITATGNWAAGAAALGAGCIAAFRGMSMVKVAGICCLVAIAAELVTQWAGIF